MPVTVREARPDRADREWLESVYRDYLDDLATSSTGLFPALGEVGHSEPDQLARWFADPGNHLLLVLHDLRPVGFALVTPGQPRAGRRRADFRMAEFFITRAHRQRGVGRSAVRLILDRFGGTWEIVEYLRNGRAVAFWRTVIAHYTAGNYEERVTNGEVWQSFVAGQARRAP